MKKTTFYFFTIALLGLILMQSCASNKGFQTARTMPEGETGFGFGIGLPKLEIRDTDDTGGILDTTNLGGFTFEFFGRYGITDKLDAGINLTILGTSGLDLKYQFLGDSESKFAGSIGAGIGYISVEVGSGSGNKNTIVDLTVPSYFSYHPSESFGLYLSPRYIFRTYGGEKTGYLGALGGLRIGKENGFFIEYGYLKSSDALFGPQTQLNLGFATNIR